jgi:hypothetical protein
LHSFWLQLPKQQNINIHTRKNIYKKHPQKWWNRRK